MGPVQCNQYLASTSNTIRMTLALSITENAPSSHAENAPMCFHCLWVNSLRAIFFRRKINTYLHFMSLLHIDMTQVPKILSPGKTRTYIFYTVNIIAADVLAT